MHPPSAEAAAALGMALNVSTSPRQDPNYPGYGGDLSFPTEADICLYRDDVWREEDGGSIVPLVNRTHPRLGASLDKLCGSMFRHLNSCAIQYLLARVGSMGRWS